MFHISCAKNMNVILIWLYICLLFKVSSAIRVCVSKGWLPEVALTAACIIETVSQWYRIMSARTKFEGLMKKDPSGKTQERIDFLNLEFIPLFQQLVPMNSSTTFLPAMKSVLISTTGVLTVYEEHVLNGIS
jgi:hypothetical protein